MSASSYPDLNWASPGLQKKITRISLTGAGKTDIFYKLACAFVIMGACLHSLILYPAIIDDAFISFRYSANLAEGHGLVFNRGELVEGYSNFLWTFIFAGIYKLGWNLPYTAWFLGLVLLIAILLTITQLGKLLNLPKPLIIVIMVVLASFTNLVGASLQGLETPLYAFFLLTSLYGLLQTDKSGWWVFAVSAAALSLTRPEGMFQAAILLAFLTLKFAFENNFRIFKPDRFWLSVGTVVLTWIVFLGSRLIFYGELLPMSVIAKRDGVTVPLNLTVTDWLQGIRYILRGLGWLEILLIILSLLSSAVVLRSKPGVLKKNWLFFGSTGAVIVLGMAVIISNKGDWMPYYRLLISYCPLILLFMTKLVYEVSLFKVKNPSLTLKITVSWVALFGIFALISYKAPAGTYPFDPNIGHYFRKYIYDQAVLNAPIDKLGYALKKAYQPGDIFEESELGRVSYYAAPMQIIDIFGLTQPVIAKSKQRSSIYGKVNPQYLGKLHPQVIANNFWPDLVSIQQYTGNEYVAVIGPELTVNRIFILIRADAANRILPAILEAFEGKVVDYNTAISEWRSIYPNGQ